MTHGCRIDLTRIGRSALARSLEQRLLGTVSTSGSVQTLAVVQDAKGKGVSSAGQPLGASFSATGKGAGKLQQDVLSGGFSATGKAPGKVQNVALTTTFSAAGKMIGKPVT